MWKQYFKFVKLRPGIVVTVQFGEIDFSADNIGIEIIKSLYENGFPYLKIQKKVKQKYIELNHSLKGTHLTKKL